MSGLGSAFGVRHASVLTKALPDNSLTKMKLRGDDSWRDELLLCSIANSLRLLPAQFSGKRSEVRKVELFGPKKKPQKAVRGYSAPVEEVDRILSGNWQEITREEAQNG